MHMRCLEIILASLIGITRSRPGASGHFPVAINCAGGETTRLDVIRLKHVVHRFSLVHTKNIAMQLKRGDTWNFVEKSWWYHYVHVVQKSSSVVLWHT